ncbi:hypothetical protein D9M68_744660 [compost metagenome]
MHFALLVSEGDEIQPQHLNLPPLPGYAQLTAQLRRLAANDAGREHLRQLFADVLAG